MDKQSTRDDTVLLVGYFDNEDKVETMRVEFRIANAELSALSTGHHGFKDSNNI